MNCPQCGQANAYTNNFCCHCGNGLLVKRDEDQIVQALICEGEGQTEKMESTLLAILSRSPHCTLAKQMLAEVYLMQGEFAKASEICRKLLLEQPRNCRAAFVSALALYYSGHVREAVTGFRQVIKTNPRFCFAYYYLGLGYIHLGKWRLAASSLSHAARMMPQNQELHYLLGLAQERRCQTGPAIDEFKKVLSTNRSDSEAKIHLKQLIQERGLDVLADDLERETVQFVDAEVFAEVYETIRMDVETPYQ